jgi:hypothetical protein
MSDKKDDEDDGFEAVVGFSVPIKRVLGHEERPENPDGSRTGSLFMTLEGCTFKEGELHGSVAATVGAPSVVIEVEGKDRDYLTTSRTSSRYIVSAHDIVQAAVNAHKARMAGTVTPDVNSVLRRLARMVWIQVGKARNPLFDQMISSGRNDRDVNERFGTWNTTQVELGRALYRVVFEGAEPGLELINRALDFLES